MNIRTILLSTVACVPMAVMADGTVTGHVICKETGDTVDYATVQLIDAATNTPLTIGTSTDSEGNFRLSGVPDGKYIVKVTNIGWVDRERPVTVNGAEVSIGDIKMSEDSKLLQEVVVEGIRSQMRFELDKKVFQVDANVVAAGSSASELLESIPSVEVDQDGEVSLRGDSSVTVWINGKESGLTADNQAQILEQIPAETIDRIEVITNPSSKYSPEGTSGIINIILKADRRAGFFGGAEIGANSRGGGNASFNFNYSSPKWDAYASLGFRMRHNKGGSVSRRTYDATDTEPSYFLNGDGSSPNHGNNLFLRAGVTYHISPKDEIYFSGFGMLGHRWGSSSTLYSSNVPGQWLSNLNLSTNKGDHRGGHIELGYKHKWSDDHTLSLMMSFNHFGGPTLNTYLQRQAWANPDPDGADIEESVYREQQMHINSNSIEAQVDYSKRFFPWLKLEAGFKGDYFHENSPNSTDKGTSTDDLLFAPELYNRFIYTMNVSALYATLGGNVGNFSYSAGVRGESWQVKTRSLHYLETSPDIWTAQTKADAEPFRKNFFSLFPSVFLSYSLPHDNEVQVNYTRRLRRPRGGQLNSFHDISDPTSISFGNPELEPQYSNAFELNYIKSFTYHILSVSAYLRTSDNCLNRISYMDDNVLYTTWANVADRRDMGVEIVSKNQLFHQVLELTTTLNLYDNHMSAWNFNFINDGKTYPISGASNHSFAWDVRMMAAVKLPWKINFQATGRYASSQLTAQGTRQGGWSVDAGLRRTFGDWSVSLNCRDIFDSRKFKSTTYGPGYEQYSERWRGGRTFQINVKYSFGNMKSKKARRDSAEPEETNYFEEMQ